LMNVGNLKTKKNLYVTCTLITSKL
jgi:hypothetical protein